MSHPQHASRRHFLYATAALGAAGLAPCAMAQGGKWPAKPIRIVVAFPPGPVWIKLAVDLGIKLD